MLIQHLLRGELVTTLSAGEVVLLLVDGEVTLEAGQAGEGLATLGTLQPRTRLMTGPVQPHVLLEVVGDAAVSTPQPLVLLVTSHVLTTTGPTVKLLTTNITRKGTFPDGFIELQLLLLGSARPPLVVLSVVCAGYGGDRGDVLGAGLLYPEHLPVVEGEDSAGCELDVRREADGLVVAHHQPLLLLHLSVWN